MKWKYHINDLERVATLYNERDTAILDVIKGRNGYCSIPRYTFIKSYEVSYLDSKKISKEQDNDTTQEALEKRLKAGCYLIEQDYISQVNKIKQVIE